MPINWESFKQTILRTTSNENSWFKNHRTAARFLTDVYDSHMKMGGDTVSRNFVITGNTISMENSLISLFDNGIGVESGRYDVFQYFTQATVSYWTGASLSTLLPPPGALSSINNITLNPGILVVGRHLEVQDRSYEYWIDELVWVLQQHLMSVSGQVIGLFPAPPGAPVPIPVPWIGYQ